MSYLIERTDQGGGYVADSSVSNSSYTFDLRKVKRFPTWEAADAERCVGNETVVELESLLRPL